MTYIVGEACIKCKFTDCVETCPVDCFYEGENFLVIDPDSCIDCGACEPACPVEAIYVDDSVPGNQTEFTQLNAKYAKLWPNIDKTKKPMESAKEYRDIKDKRHLLSPEPYKEIL